MKVEITGSGSILSSSLSASALVDDHIQIDVPNGYCKRRREAGADLSKIDIILITHFHGDHYFDMPFLLMELGLRRERETPLRIYGPPGLEKRLEELHGFAFANWERVKNNCKAQFTELDETPISETIGTKVYNIAPISVVHAEMVAFGFLIESEGKCLGYTGDSVICDGVNQIIETAQTIVIDGSFENDTADHIGFHTAANIADRPEYKGKTFVCTHMTDKVRSIQYDGCLHRPSDGKEFIVGE